MTNNSLDPDLKGCLSAGFLTMLVALLVWLVMAAFTFFMFWLFECPLVGTDRNAAIVATAMITGLGMFFASME